MNNNLEIFNEIRSNLSLLVEKNKGLKINGIDDIENYIKVKEAKAETRKAEIELERLAKQEREGALNYQRGIIALEKDLKKITSPLIEDYTKQLEEIDKAKAREERRLILPDRVKSLQEIELKMTDEEILDLEEKEWANFFTTKKMAYLEAKEQARLATERAEREEKEKADRLAIEEENTRLRAEKEAIEKEKREKEEAEAKEAKRIADEEADRKAKMRGDKYEAFLKNCGINDQNKDDFKIIETYKGMDLEVAVYKKVNSIIL